MKEIIYKMVLEAVIKKIIASAPFLSTPIINPIFLFIIRKIFDRVYSEMSLHGAFIMIDLKTEAEKNRYQKAVENLKNAMQKQGSADEEKEKFKETLRDLIRFRTV